MDTEALSERFGLAGKTIILKGMLDTFCCGEANLGCKEEGGIAFALHPLLEQPCGVSNRFISLWVPLPCEYRVHDGNP